METKIVQMLEEVDKELKEKINQLTEHTEKHKFVIIRTKVQDIISDLLLIELKEKV